VLPVETNDEDDEIVIDCKAALVTRTLAELVKDPEVAVSVVVPAATPVARQLLLTVAVAGLEDVHVTVLKSLVLPSSFTPVAVNC
jgi:hypothetical protein